MRKVAITFALMALGFGAYAQHDHGDHEMKKEAAMEAEPTFEDENLNEAYSHYIRLKDALVASEAETAKAAAKELTSSLEEVKDGKGASAVAENISASPSLEEQRKKFSELSDAMAKMVKSAELAEGAVYVEYCPMANGGEGAQWLANEKQINNPYFGDRMLRCGKVRETIK